MREGGIHSSSVTSHTVFEGSSSLITDRGHCIFHFVSNSDVDTSWIKDNRGLSGEDGAHKYSGGIRNEILYFPSYSHLPPTFPGTYCSTASPAFCSPTNASILESAIFLNASAVRKA
jgi:hypothetical protein